MASLSTPNPGSAFDRSVVLRTWLSNLPQPPVSAGFDDVVLKRARSGAAGGMVVPMFMGTIAVMIIAGIIGFILMQPTPVEVTHVPMSLVPPVDLYDVKPASIKEDMRFEHRKKPEAAPVPFGVAGR